MRFSHELHVDAERCCLVLHGEIDLSVRDWLYAALHCALGVSPGFVELDFRDVTFLDCSGVGVLIAAVNRARDHGQELAVTHVHGMVRQILELTNVLDHLTGPMPALPHGSARPAPVPAVRLAQGWSTESSTDKGSASVNLSIETHAVDDGVVRLAVAGEVDLATCDVLDIVIKQWVTDGGGAAEVVIDLDQVTFLDSSGIEVLIRGQRAAAEAGIGYLVTNPRHIVRRILEISGVLFTLTHPYPYSTTAA